jgi:hypothetical protein
MLAAHFGNSFLSCRTANLDFDGVKKELDITDIILGFIIFIFPRHMPSPLGCTIRPYLEQRIEKQRNRKKMYELRKYKNKRSEKTT